MDRSVNEPSYVTVKTGLRLLEVCSHWCPSLIGWTKPNQSNITQIRSQGKISWILPDPFSLPLLAFLRSSGQTSDRDPLQWRGVFPFRIFVTVTCLSLGSSEKRYISDGKGLGSRWKRDRLRGREDSRRRKKTRGSKCLYTEYHDPKQIPKKTYYKSEYHEREKTRPIYGHKRDN